MADIGAVAQANADLKYGASLDALKRRIASGEQAMLANETALQGYGNTGRGIIGQVYDVLDKSLAENRTNTGQQLQASAQNVGQGYRDAQNVLDAQRNLARDYASQAGVADNQQAAYAEQQAKLENVFADLIGRNAQNDATWTGNLKNWAGMMDSIFSKGQDIGRQQRADAGSRFETALLDLLGENRLNAQREATDISGQIAQIMGERGSFLVSEGDRLAQQAWERAIQEAQMAQQAAIAQAEMDLRSRAMAQESAARSDDSRWKQMEFDQRNRAFEQGVRESDRNYQRGIIESDRDFGLRQTAAGQTNNDDYFKAISILSDPAASATLSPAARIRLEDIAGINTTRTQARDSGKGAAGVLGSVFAPGGVKPASNKPGFFDNQYNPDEYWANRLVRKIGGFF